MTTLIGLAVIAFGTLLVYLLTLIHPFAPLALFMAVGAGFGIKLSAEMIGEGILEAIARRRQLKIYRTAAKEELQ